MQPVGRPVLLAWERREVRGGHEDVVQPVVRGEEVSYIASGNDRYASVPCKGRYFSHAPPPGRRLVIGQLDVEPVPECLMQMAQNLGRFFTLLGKYHARQEPERDGSGQADQTFSMLQDLPQRTDRTAPVRRRCPVIRDEPAQGAVAFYGLGKQHDVTTRRRDLGPDDGKNARLVGRLEEAGNTVEPVAVRERQRGHSHVRRSLHQLFRSCDPETEGEPAPDVQMDEVVRGLSVQSVTPTRNHSPSFSRARSTTEPSERRSLARLLFFARSSSHHARTSRQRPSTSTTCRFLRHRLRSEARVTRRRPWRFSSSTGSHRACAACPPFPSISEARESHGARSR